MEAILDAIKYVFKKGIQINNQELVTDVNRRDFVPKEYLHHVISEVKSSEDEETPIFLPERVISIPIQQTETKWKCKYN